MLRSKAVSKYVMLIGRFKFKHFKHMSVNHLVMEMVISQYGKNQATNPTLLSIKISYKLRLNQYHSNMHRTGAKICTHARSHVLVAHLKGYRIRVEV
jgi:hypothetical protein